LAPTLEDLFKFILKNRAERVQVLNKVQAASVEGRWEHNFTVTVHVAYGVNSKTFIFDSGKVESNHELREDKTEKSPEYEIFQRSLLSMFHLINTIDRRLALIKQTKLKDLQIEVQA